MNAAAMSLGERVRIVTAPETEAAGFAGRTGVVYGWTTRSQTEVAVIGTPTDDLAYKVGFEERETEGWFAPHLLEVIDQNPAPETTVDDQETAPDNSGKRSRPWPFKPRGRKTRRRVKDGDEKPDAEFWSRRRPSS